MSHKEAGRELVSVILCLKCAPPLKVTNPKADYMSAVKNHQSFG